LIPPLMDGRSLEKQTNHNFLNSEAHYRINNI
jgi:hypothetical protein